MMDIGLTPDDPTVVYLASADCWSRPPEPSRQRSIPYPNVSSRPRPCGRSVAEAASARVEAAHAALAERTGAAVAEAAAAHLTRIERTRMREVGFWAAAIVLGCGILCGGAGYWLGRGDTQGLDAKWAGLTQRLTPGRGSPW